MHLASLYHTGSDFTMCRLLYFFRRAKQQTRNMLGEREEETGSDTR